MPPCAHQRSPATLRPWGRKALAPFGAEGATLPLLTSVDRTVDGRYSAVVVPTAAQSSSNEIVRTLKSSVAGLALLDWLRLTRQFSEGLTTKFSVIRCVSGTLKNRGVILSCSVLFCSCSPHHYIFDNRLKRNHGRMSGSHPHQESQCRRRRH
jgi:hypothetical protein